MCQEEVMFFKKWLRSWKVLVVNSIGQAGSLLPLWCPIEVALDKVIVSNRWLAYKLKVFLEYVLSTNQCVWSKHVHPKVRSLERN